MFGRSTTRQGSSAWGAALGMIVLALSCSVAIAAPGADDTKPAEERVAVATLITDTGTVMARKSGGTGWSVVAKGADVFSGDTLVGLPGAEIESKSKAVRITLLSDLSETSPLPILETAVLLHASKGMDLDFTLGRGRVDLENLKSKGSARVQVRFQGEAWQLALNTGDARVAVETYGRWQAGTTFKKDPPPGYGPIVETILLVLKGQVDLVHGIYQHAMTAPPGPAFFQWDSVTGSDQRPQRLEKLPGWATEDETSPRAMEAKANIKAIAKMTASRPVEEVIKELLNAPEPRRRRAAVIMMGALDQLQMLGNALNEGKNPDVWENAIVVLRHWIGREKGQDQIVYESLMKNRSYSPAQAEIVLNLLHGFSARDLSQPETFETLIEYLRHPKLGIRGLASWYLYRLVPGANQIAYNPNGSSEDHERAYNEWKKLVPSGTLPALRRPGQ